MLFSGIVCDVSKSFQIKGNNGSNAIFFTIMKNTKGSAKYIKCLTSDENLINDLVRNSKSNDIFMIVNDGYPDTSYSKDYLNTVTNKQGVYLQHFVVTNALINMKEVKQENTPEISKNQNFDWDWDLDTKENN